MNAGSLLVVGIIAMMIPIGVGTIVARRKTLKWQETLLIGGISILPVVTVLAIQRVVRPMTIVIVLGVLTGHVLTFLDTD
ncbi:MAG: hypothetical protein ABEJ76_05270 [Halanaeroarchaeum sp.]